MLCRLRSATSGSDFLVFVSNGGPSVGFVVSVAVLGCWVAWRGLGDRTRLRSVSTAAGRSPKIWQRLKAVDVKYMQLRAWLVKRYERDSRTPIIAIV